MSADSILILGATSDLGLALAEHLLAEGGSRIIAHGHAGLERLQALADTHPGRVLPERADLSDPAEVRGFLETVRSRHGVPHGIVHFPALPLRLERFSKWDAERFRADFAIQLESIVQILGAFLPDMARRKEPAKILFVLSSVTLGVPARFMSMYTVVKYAQLGLMRALAAEYSATCVRVNAVSPAMVETRFLSAIPEQAVAQSAAMMPGQRNLLPLDIVKPMAFLLGSGSDHISGVNLPLTEGSAC